jgi:hypothetical protein
LEIKSWEFLIFKKGLGFFLFSDLKPKIALGNLEFLILNKGFEFLKNLNPKLRHAKFKNWDFLIFT